MKPLALALVAIALAAATARADDVGDAAALFDAGTKAYAAGDYATAITEYEEAYRLDPLPEVAFSLAQAHRNQYFVDRDLLHLERALGLYRTYLDEAPKGKRRRHATLHIETIEIILAHEPTADAVAPAHPSTELLVTSETAGATAQVDGDAAAPTPRLVEVTPGSHHVRVDAPGHDPAETDALAVAERLVVVALAPHAKPARLAVHAASGAHIWLDGIDLGVAPVASLEVEAGDHRLAVQRRGHRAAVRRVALRADESVTLALDAPTTPQRRAAHVVAWASLGLSIAAGVTSLLALDAQRDARDLPPAPRTMADVVSYDDAIQRRDDWRAAALSLGASALVSGAVAAALWWFDVPSVHESPASLAVRF